MVVGRPYEEGHPSQCGFANPPPEDSPDREQLDRFAEFLRIVNEAPKDDQGRSIVGPRAIRYAKGEDVSPLGCTGVSARWCPVHGSCVCPQDGDLDRGDWAGDLDRPDCPLHAPGGEHPILDEMTSCPPEWE